MRTSITILGLLYAVAAAQVCEPNLVPFEQDGKWGYRDVSGQIIIAPRFDMAKPFQDGLARVNVGGAYDMHRMFEGGQWGFVNAHRKLVIEPRFSAVYDFCEGMALFLNEKGFGFINKKGVVVLNLGDRFKGERVRSADSFSEGLAAEGNLPRCGRVAEVLDLEVGTPAVRADNLTFRGHGSGLLVRSVSGVDRVRRGPAAGLLYAMAGSRANVNPE